MRLSVEVRCSFARRPVEPRSQEYYTRHESNPDQHHELFKKNPKERLSPFLRNFDLKMRDQFLALSNYNSRF